VFAIFAAVLLWGDFRTHPKMHPLFTPRRRPRWFCTSARTAQESDPLW